MSDFRIFTNTQLSIRVPNGKFKYEDGVTIVWNEKVRYTFPPNSVSYVEEKGS